MWMTCNLLPLEYINRLSVETVFVWHLSRKHRHTHEFECSLHSTDAEYLFDFSLCDYDGSYSIRKSNFYIELLRFIQSIDTIRSKGFRWTIAANTLIKPFIDVLLPRTIGLADCCRSFHSTITTHNFMANAECIKQTCVSICMLGART